jgi:hypothetical protein
MKFLSIFLLLSLCSCGLMAQSSVEEPAATATPIDKRVLGVLPNYRTADGTIPFEPISAGRKLNIAAKDSFDYPVYLLSASFAGLGQIANQNPSFGQGLAGFGKRFGAGYGDQMIGNMLAEGIVPALMHEDPRYFRIGPSAGGPGLRIRYALTRILITKTDNNTKRFNFSEIGGNAVATAISNAYLPDQRNVSDNIQKFAYSVGTDAISNVIKEFWPDVKRKFLARRAANAATHP